jgi:hypothetical protein
MKEFWSREWLLNHIGEQHKTQRILTALEIAQNQGFICEDGYLTESGQRYIEQNREVFSLLE